MSPIWRSEADWFPFSILQSTQYGMSNTRRPTNRRGPATPHELFALQHGLATDRQLRTIGVSWEQQRAMLRNSSWTRVAAGVLALLLGGLGFHKTYLGVYGTALIYLALCWTGLPMLVSFVEGARYLSLTDAEFKAKASHNPGPFQFIW